MSTSAADFRPTYKLSILFKVFEPIVYNGGIYKFIENNITYH